MRRNYVTRISIGESMHGCSIVRSHVGNHKEYVGRDLRDKGKKKKKFLFFQSLSVLL